MAIYKKTDLIKHIHELEERYQTLRTALEGATPNPNIYDQYSINSEEFSQYFVEISADDLNYALQDFKSVLGIIQKIDKKKAKKLGR